MAVCALNAVDLQEVVLAVDVPGFRHFAACNVDYNYTKTATEVGFAIGKVDVINLFISQNGALRDIGECEGATFSDDVEHA